jgi:hypothetical protein
MRTRAAILSGVAAAAITLAGSAALAQSNYDRYGNGPQESTPAEMQQTDQLNQQSTDAAASDRATQAQDQTQYQDQQQQYNDQMQNYHAQQQRYQFNRERYNANLAAYNLAQYEWNYPAPVVYRYDGYGLQPLYLMAEPSQQLWQVPVAGPGGHWVGRVRNVETAPDGRPSRVEIALNRRVSVWVHPGDLRFDPYERVLYTDLSREDLWDMPGATISSGPM